MKKNKTVFMITAALLRYKSTVSSWHLCTQPVSYPPIIQFSCLYFSIPALPLQYFEISPAAVIVSLHLNFLTDVNPTQKCRKDR